MGKIFFKLKIISTVLKWNTRQVLNFRLEFFWLLIFICLFVKCKMENANIEQKCLNCYKIGYLTIWGERKRERTLTVVDNGA